MAPSPHRAAVFALYQFSIVLGIALLPVALARVPAAPLRSNIGNRKLLSASGCTTM